MTDRDWIQALGKRLGFPLMQVEGARFEQHDRVLASLNLDRKVM